MTPSDCARPTDRAAALLSPRSIAVVGASDRPGVGQRVVANLQAAGFSGDLYAVNPKYSSVSDLPTFPSLGDLPSIPDLVVAAVNREATVRTVAEAARRGCKAAVLLASGFGESDATGRRLEEELRAVSTGMSLMGPNCLGYVNFVDRIAVYSGPLMEPPVCGSTALVSQSGALAATLTGAAAERGMSFSHVITTGNQIDLNLTDYVRYLAAVPDVGVVACYVEGFQDGRALLAAMDEAAERGKSVIVLKGGRSSMGGAAARTHTGALAGSATVQVGLWRQHDVLMADDLEEFLALIELCAHPGALRGPGVAVITISGGERLLTADAAEEFAVPLAELSAETRGELGRILPSYATVANPLDTTGAGIVDGNRDLHARAAAVVARDPGVDVLIACQDAKNGWVQAQEASTLFYDCVTVASEAAREAGKAAIVVSPTTGQTDSRTREYLHERDVPYLMGLRAGMAALAQVIHRSWPKEAGVQHHLGSPGALSNAGGEALSGYAALMRLEAEGVTVWPTRLARSEDEAMAAAADLGYPVALKVDGTGIQHRTDLGGVRLGLASGSEVRAAWREVIDRVPAAGGRVDGMLVQPMAPSGVELFIGGLKDEQFGSVVLCGPGGVLLEVTREIAVGLAPLSSTTASDLLRGTRAFRLLDGFRGAPRADIARVLEVLVKVSQVIADPDVRALDINPLIAFPGGVALVDAKLVPDGPAPSALRGDGT